MHAPLRAGSDNAFLGGVINYILSNELDFREYVLAYTNASFLVDERYQDTEDLDGLFSGYNPPTTSYDPSSWHYPHELHRHGRPRSCQRVLDALPARLGTPQGGTRTVTVTLGQLPGS